MNEHRGLRSSSQLAVLGLPALGIALAYTVATTYLPVLLERLSNPATTGLMIGGEGLLSLIVPVLVGKWSDTTSTRFGSRMPFVVAGAALCVVGLLVIPATTRSLLGMGIGLAVFFLGYFVYYSPYYALFPDVVPDSQRGRSQGVQGGFRSVGMLASLAVGGLLMQWWLPLPFVVSAVAIAVTTLVLHRSLRREFRGSGAQPQRSSGDEVEEWRMVRTSPDIRRWAIANALWETAVGALRVFVVLYFTEGLRLSLAQVSGALALVGAAAVLAAPISGALADRFGHRPVMKTALWIFALGVLPAVFTTDTRFVTAIIPIAFAAVVLLTLPYSMLMGMLPARQEHGVAAGLYGFSRGIGVLLGPLLGGLAVEVCSSWDFLVFSRTAGYSAVFALTSIVLLLSIPLLTRMSETHDPRRQPK